VIVDLGVIRYIPLLFFICLASGQDCTADDGTEGVELWGECYSIENTTALDLSYNGVTGAIPPEIGNLVNLNSLILKENQLNGEIPPEISYLTNLTQLDLGGNQFTGEIPPGISCLTNLNILDLAGNQFMGSLPPEIGTLTSLTELELGGNQFTGAIPPEIGDLVSLTFIHLEYNQFTGEIPPAIGNLTNLVWLNFVHNQLTGEIPSSICNLDMNWSDPNNFNISDNQLCPPYPSCIEDHMGDQDTTNCNQVLICDEGFIEIDGFCFYEDDIAFLQQVLDNSTETVNINFDDTTSTAYNTIDGNEYRFANGNGIVEPLEIGIKEWENGRLRSIMCGAYIYCDLSGPIPESIVLLTEIDVLRFELNQFSGFIPESICELGVDFAYNLDFDLSWNYLCPPYPSCIEDYMGEQDTTNCEQVSIIDETLPITYKLHNSYPNPFNPVTTIRYELPEDGLVNITIYDMMGRVVKKLINDQQTAGYRSLQWNATNDAGSPVSAGIYLYMIQAGEFRQTKKMVLLK